MRLVLPMFSQEFKLAHLVSCWKPSSEVTVSVERTELKKRFLSWGQLMVGISFTLYKTCRKVYKCVAPEHIDFKYDN